MTDAISLSPANAAQAIKTATIYRMVMPHHICPYGLKAIDLLKRKGFAVEDRWLEQSQLTVNGRSLHYRPDVAHDRFQLDAPDSR